MIEIKLSFNTLAEAQEFLAGKASASTDKPAKADAKPKADTKVEAKPEVKAEPTGPKREDVSAKVVMLATKDQAAAVELLKSFGVSKARELKDEDLAAALKGAEAALATLDMA